MRFRLVPKSETLNDIERRNGHYFGTCKTLRLSVFNKELLTYLFRGIR